MLNRVGTFCGTKGSMRNIFGGGEKGERNWLESEKTLSGENGESCTRLRVESLSRMDGN